jgi:hypothetical protein
MSPILSTFAAGSVRGFTSAGGGALWELVDGVYVWGGGAITGVSDFDEVALNALPESSIIYIRYPLRVGSSTQTITAAACRNSSLLSQSIFSYNPLSNISYLGSISSPVSNSNDDNDALAMDGDGAGIVAWDANANSPTQGNWARITGTSVTTTNAADPWMVTPFPSNVQQHLIAFPGTGYATWIKPGNSQIRVGNTSSTYSDRSGTSAELGDVFNYSGDIKNNIYSISDGINSFVIGRWGQNNAQYIEIDLTDGSIHHSSQINYTSNPSQHDSTEEDFNGDQLFAINGAVSYHHDGNFIYGGTTGFRSHPGPFNSSGKQTFSAGTNADQTGMDICTTVDSNRYLYFGDWGHDNGGLFNRGDDDRLSIRETSVRMLTATSTPSSL